VPEFSKKLYLCKIFKTAARPLIPLGLLGSSNYTGFLHLYLLLITENPLFPLIEVRSGLLFFPEDLLFLDLREFPDIYAF
jgi:hypothetical protein